MRHPRARAKRIVDVRAMSAWATVAALSLLRCENNACGPAEVRYGDTCAIPCAAVPGALCARDGAVLTDGASAGDSSLALESSVDASREGAVDATYDVTSDHAIGDAALRDLGTDASMNDTGFDARDANDANDANDASDASLGDVAGDTLDVTSPRDATSAEAGIDDASANDSDTRDGSDASVDGADACTEGAGCDTGVPCERGELRCVAGVPRCTRVGFVTEGTRCPTGVCLADGRCAAQRSCPDGAERGCGTVAIAAGGPFTMGHDPEVLPLVPGVRVSAFRLDAYEVTVGRFRRFWAAGHPAPSSPIAYPGGPVAWSGTVRTPTVSGATGCTWIEPATASSESLPLNCVDWSTAMAFCAWDGGRLPTEAEWEYAARYRPISGLSAPRDWVFTNEMNPENICQYAVYGPLGCGPSLGETPLAVGSRDPIGGLFDLQGNVSEIVADTPSTSSYSECVDSRLVDPICLGTADGTNTRGGTFDVNDTSALTSWQRGGALPLDARYGTLSGFRCAH